MFFQVIILKRFITLISVFILIISFCITAFSFKIDGSDDNVEWEDSDSVVLFMNEESNCNIDFGSYKWAVEDESLYICFNFFENNFDHTNSYLGISFSIEDSEFYTLDTEMTTVFDSDKYRVEAAMLYDGAYGAACETRIGFKHGIPSQINGKVRFVDSEGAYSNVYYYTINHIPYTNTYIETEFPTTKPVKTTIATATKADKTTKNKTTTKKTTDDGLGLLDFLIDNETTKPPKTTKAKTTKEKTTRSVKEKKTKVVVVTSFVFIENEISSEITEPITDIYNEQTEIITSSPVSTPDGKKYQMLTAVAGAIVLVAVAVIGTYSANKKANKESSESDNNE